MLSGQELWPPCSFLKPIPSLGSAHSRDTIDVCRTVCCLTQVWGPSQGLSLAGWGSRAVTLSAQEGGQCSPVRVTPALPYDDLLVISGVQMRKLSHQAVKLPAQDHTAGMWPSWGPKNLGNGTGLPDACPAPAPTSSCLASSSEPGMDKVLWRYLWNE